MNTMEAGVKFWYETIGANVIPADTKNKKTWVPWAKYQQEPIPQEQIDLWFRQDAFKDGIAVVAGKLWRGKYKDKYLIAIDCDNRLAIEELCTFNGKPIPLITMAMKWLVEQHKDDENKAHVYVISDMSFPKKASNAVSMGDKLTSNALPAFEIKGEGTHGIMYCSPSPHKRGQPYEIIGKDGQGNLILPTPLTLDQSKELIDRIDKICRKYGLQYLERITNESMAKPMLFDKEFRVFEGNNRHVRVLALMESLIHRLGATDVDEKVIRDIAEDFNKRKCVPPLTPDQMDFQWKCAMRFMEHEVEYERVIAPPERAYRLNKQYIDKEVMVEGKIHLIGKIKQVNVANIYECRQCKIISEQKLTRCRNCQSEDIKVIQNTDTVKDHRYLHLTVFDKNGRPSKEEVWISCYDGLANKDYLLNDEIRVNGTVRLAESHEKSVVKNIKELFIYVHASEIEPITEKEEETTLLDEERTKLKEWAENSEVVPGLTKLFAPRIIGRDLIKECILYQIVSGDFENETQIREDMHILVIGDPSEGKTVLGLAAADISEGVHTSGESISKAGIGAGIVQNKEIGGYVLEPGIAMYGNRKFKFLDEIDKMPKEYVDDLVNILEIGQFKVDKIIHHLCETKGPWLCAGNPKNGIFDKNNTLVQNINLPNYLLERFDLIFILRKNYDDAVLTERTDAMANAFMNKKGNKLDIAWLKKYLILAKEPRPLTFEPQVKEKIQKFFKRVVKVSEFGGIPVSNRQFLGMLRMAVARAKLHLRDNVTEADAQRAIEIMSSMMIMAGIDEDTIKAINLNMMGEE